ncbi:patatin-like phospholipase family protein [Mesorhizobium sp. BR1-1-16]|uniref:patatin-like phospholipase family protein n=1 Tax=Mesorhizobium sp. BR1-1-16 TaxID=2876653 RepID=UPI001CC9A699|nr:patatin-like phospholipase family protein [Mesorhizobium sp. BR1-1-16]MBZ9937928.1 patatin-like phospholipase family protein [Mesorhizobium sp. BR1-1-16]
MTPSRRGFITMSAGISAASVLPAAASATESCVDPVTAMAEAVSNGLFADDGLARPAPMTPTVSNLAAGLDRTLVLGGGGEYYVAWYCGFFHGLLELGFDPNLAEMVVGTSAGAYMGSSLTSGHFARLRTEFDFFGHFPSLFAKMAPVSSANASQKRAQEINFKVTNGDPASIQAIGHAALASDNRVNGDAVERLAWLLTGDSKTDWPVAKMFTTANDCYTGERLVVGQAVARRNGIPLAHAAGASSSLPGVIGPTLLGQRYCMDGGIARTWAHTDIVAGSKRALVITLTNGHDGTVLTGIPHNINTEIAALEATGTKAMLIIAGTPPGVNLLDPKEIAPALKAGYDRAKTEAPKIQQFWS